MALELDSRYPGRFTPGDADYPQGSFKNRTAPGALDGSYLEKDWANDKEGFFQRLMLVAGISPNGSVDTAQASQYYNALLQIIADNAADTLNAPIASVAVAGTVDLTAGAPATSNIVFTGSGTINNFTVAANRDFIVRFNGAATLTNSASLVTNSGANIVTAAGDTCIMRATAANTVEILMFVRGVIGQSKAVSGYRVFHDGTATPLICQWGTAATASSNNVTANFPIPFPNNFFQATTSHGTTGTPSATGYGVTTNSTINLRISVSGNSEIKYIAWGN